MSRDLGSARRGYSPESYLIIIEGYLPAIRESGKESMQDNAPIHTANIIENGLRSMTFLLLTDRPTRPI